MSETLEIFGAEYSGVNGIKATDDNGTVHTYIKPSGTLSVTENGMVDVTNYASVNVNVSGGGGGGNANTTLYQFHFNSFVPQTESTETLADLGLTPSDFVQGNGKQIFAWLTVENIVTPFIYDAYDGSTSNSISSLYSSDFSNGTSHVGYESRFGNLVIVIAFGSRFIGTCYIGAENASSASKLKMYYNAGNYAGSYTQTYDGSWYNRGRIKFTSASADITLNILFVDAI